MAALLTACGGGGDSSNAFQTAAANTTPPKVATLSVTASPQSIPTDGSQSSSIKVYVRDSTNVLMAGVTVTFAASSGGIAVNQATTDTNGLATATLTTGGDATPRTITVTASAGGQSGTTTVTVVAPVAKVVLTSSTATIPTDGAVSAVITATVRDSGNAAVAGVPVSFTATSGTVAVTSAVTDATGVAKATLSTGSDPSLRIITVRATAAGITGSTDVTVGGYYTITATSSSPTLQSDGSTPVQIRAYIRNPSNQLVSGVPVTFSASSGGLQVTQASTDASGVALASLSTASDATNRSITVTVSAGGVSSTVGVDVVGTRLTIQGQSTLTLAQQGTYNLLLVDSAGKAIAGKVLTATSKTGNTVTPASVTTDSNGRGSVTLTATQLATDTLTVSGFSLTATQSIAVGSDSFTFTSPAAATEINLGSTQAVTVTWLRANAPLVGQTVNFSTTRGTITASAVTDANGVATANLSSTVDAGGATVTASGGTNSAQRSFEFVATTPTAIVLQPDASSLSPTQSTNVTAVVRDASGNPVKNKTVLFTIQDVSGGTLSIGSATTDSLGRAVTVYTAGSLTSAANGVKVTGTVQGTTVTNTVSLTVAQRALYISLGTGNSMTDGGTSYSVPFVAQVTDANGNVVANVSLTTQVLSRKYYKGYRALNGAGTAWVTTLTATCTDEDLNHNGILDAGEDLNASGKIEAGNVAGVAPGTITTDTNGMASLTVSYPKNFAGYVDVDLKVSATVQGTEFQRTSSFTLGALASDFSNITVTPPGPVSPFGRSALCTDTL